MTDLCTMCERRPSTTTWGFPVCQECADMLSELQGELDAMEAADPDLAEKGRRAEAALEQMALRAGALTRLGTFNVGQLRQALRYCADDQLVMLSVLGDLIDVDHVEIDELVVRLVGAEEVVTHG